MVKRSDTVHKMSWLILFVTMVLTNGITAQDNKCNGIITVTEPVLENRPVRVTFSSRRLQQNDISWAIYKDNRWYKQVEHPQMIDNTFQNTSISTVTITNIDQWNFVKVHVTLWNASNKRVCYQQQNIEKTNLGECGKLSVSNTFIREGRSVDLELLLKHRQEYRSFTLLFINDANDQTILNLENMHGRTLPFTYTLDSPRSDGIYLVMCDTEVKTYSTTLQLEKAVKPSVPKLKTNGKVGGCNNCVYVSAEEDWVWIKCNVSGGTGPKNVTISVGTHTLPGIFYNNLYMSYFIRDQLKHGSEVRCEVLNPALDHPLKTTKNVYIYREKRPNFTEIKLYDVIAGGEGTIECVSTDMRPASNLILNVEDISCNTTIDVSENNNTDTCNVTAICSFTASKTLHNKIVKCCVSYQGDKHCQTKQLNILFPPGHVEAKQVEFQDDEEKFKQTVLSCYVSSANPPCRARWEIPPEITDYRTENFNRTIGLNEREKILSKSFLNATRLNHGQQIRCIAVCGNFTVKSDVVSLNVPGAPLMKVFPGNMVTKREGESLTLNCTVDSIPKSNLSWNHGKGTLKEQGSTRCDNYSKCFQTYHFESLDKSQTGNYTCTAHNNQFEPTKEIVLLRVIEPDSVTGNNENLLKKTWFIPAVTGGGATVLIVIFIVVVITVTRRKKTKTNSMEPNGHNDRQDAGDHIQGEIEEEHDANIGGEQGAGVENVTYATVVKDNVRPSTSKDRQVSHDDGQESKEESKEGGNASSITEQVQIDNTYAQVLPRAERQKQSQNVKVSHDDGQESKEESKEGGNASSITEQVQIDNTYAQVLPRAERQKQSQNVKVSHDDGQESKEESKEGGNASSITEQVQIDNTYAQVLPRAERQKQSQNVKVSHDDGQESKEESKEGGNASSITEQVQIDNTYAQVLPRAERQKQSQNVKASASASGEKELVNLDVEFNKALPGSKVKGGRQSDVERTEYVSIDLNKKVPTDS